MRLKLKILFVTLLCMQCMHGGAQQHKIDSLRKILAGTKDDSIKCEILLKIGSAQEGIDHRASRKTYDSIVHLAQKGNYKLMEAEAYLAIGGLGFYHGDYQSAITYYNQAAVHYNFIDGDNRTLGLAAVYNNLGGVLSLVNEWENAQKYYFKAIKEYEKLKDTTRLVTVYFNIAFIFSDMDEWKKSYDYMLTAFQLSKRSRNNSQNVHVCCRLATICFKMKRFSEGLNLLEKADSLIRLSHEDLDLIYYHHAYGGYYDQIKAFSLARKHHKLAYDYAVKWDDPYYITDESLEIGKDYLNEKQFDSAGVYFQRSYDVGIQHNYKPKVLLSLSYLSHLESAKGDFKKAYDYKNKQAVFADSLVKEQNHYRILLLDEEFESEKRSNEIEQLRKDKQIQALSLKQKSTLNYFLFSSIAALLIVGFLVYRNLHHRHTLAQQQDELQQQRIRELEKDKQLVAVDSMLKGQEEERSRMAKDLHDGLGGMLSGVKLSLGAMKGNIILSEDNTRLFGRVLDQLDHSINEMRRVAHNMMPEALVKLGLPQAVQDYCDGLNESNNLFFKTQFYALEKRLDTATEIVVYRILQELLNNVVKHAEATEALVQIMRHDNALTITIEDNGKGFDVGSVHKKGAGLSNVQSRVDYLKGQLDIQSVPGKGTSVHIDFTIQDT